MRCLIVDDSPSFRAVLKGILRTAPGIEVIGEASDGDMAVAMARELRPDAITMDLNMPKRDGLAAIREIMISVPTPIIVVCGGGDDRALAFRALELGAIEVLEKPDSTEGHFERQAEAIRLALGAVVGLKLVTRHPRRSVESRALRPAGQVACVGIAASTGGPEALHRVLSALPRDFPVPILVVQHVADGFTPALTKWLNEHCAIDVAVAVDGEPLRPGTARFAPDRRHLTVARGAVRLDDGPPVRGFRPSGTVLLTSLAQELGPAAAGLVLTGMGDDGSAGLQLIKEHGGFTAAQGPATSIIYGMPKVAFESGAAKESLELGDIAPALLSLVGRPGTRRKLVLLIEADAAALMTERQFLAQDYAVQLARTWEEALIKIAAVRPDMLVIGAADGGVGLPTRSALSGVPAVLVVRKEELAGYRAHPHPWAAIIARPLEPLSFLKAVRGAMT